MKSHSWPTLDIHNPCPLCDWSQHALCKGFHFFSFYIYSHIQFTTLDLPSPSCYIQGLWSVLSVLFRLEWLFVCKHLIVYVGEHGLSAHLTLPYPLCQETVTKVQVLVMARADKSGEMWKNSYKCWNVMAYPVLIFIMLVSPDWSGVSNFTQEFSLALYGHIKPCSCQGTAQELLFCSHTCAQLKHAYTTLCVEWYLYAAFPVSVTS